MRPRLLAGLILAALALFALGSWLAPDPLPFRESLRAGNAVPTPDRLVVDGLAGARYDAGRDVTYAVFRCGHWPCDHAIPIRGDVTGTLPRGRVLLVAEAPGGTAGPLPLDPPLTPPSSVTAVEVTTDAVFRVAPLWPGPLARGLGLALLAALLPLTQAGRLSRAAWPLAAAGALGVPVAALLLARGQEVAFVLGLYLLLPGLVALAWLLVRLLGRRLAPGPLATLLFLAAYWGGLLSLAPWFPSEPAL